MQPAGNGGGLESGQVPEPRWELTIHELASALRPSTPALRPRQGGREAAVAIAAGSPPVSSPRPHYRHCHQFAQP